MWVMLAAPAGKLTSDRGTVLTTGQLLLRFTSVKYEHRRLRRSRLADALGCQPRVARQHRHLMGSWTVVPLPKPAWSVATRSTRRRVSACSSAARVITAL